jgi:SAM-dependent methyltransferase
MPKETTHPELLRLVTEFNWRLPSTTHMTPTDSAYSDEHTRERAELDRTSWWYQTRNRIIQKVLQPLPRDCVLWDIGCGTGVVIEALTKDGRTVIGLEPSAAGADIAASFGQTVLPTTLESLRLPSGSIRAISLFDVLEHIADRQALLREVRRVLKPDGYLVLTVPAMTWLWSSFDEDERHHLRYTKRTLSAELSASGFKVRKSGYFFLLTVPPLLLLRALPYRFGWRTALTDTTAVGPSGGTTGQVLAKIETALSMRTPLGSSLLAIAQPE